MIYSSCFGCCGGVAYAAPASAPAIPKNSSTPRTESARITVKLPSTARLWVDDVSCPLTSGERSFSTPSLSPGQQYFYTLRMEVERDGRTVSENRRVYLAAGQQVSVDFNAPATVTAQR